MATRAAGEETRRTILRSAAAIASVDGLDGLSIGGLATELGMSKSGLFAHFGSKESLQLATIEEARQRYVDEVITPALAAGPGITRLQALCELFLSYVERGVFPGGCFFASAMVEFDCKQPGPVRELVAGCQDQWMEMLVRAGDDAIALGHLQAGCDPRQLAFDLQGALLSANWYVHLFDDDVYLQRARRSLQTHLAGAATRTGGRALATATPARTSGARWSRAQ